MRRMSKIMARNSMLVPAKKPLNVDIVGDAHHNNTADWHISYFGESVFQAQEFDHVKVNSLIVVNVSACDYHDSSSVIPVALDR